MPPAADRLPTAWRVYAEVDLAALRHNVDTMAARLRPGTHVLAVLKADGYGHGAIPMARALAGRVHYLGVGDSQEALELRRAGITTPVLILGAIIEGEVERVVESDVTACVHDATRALQLDAAAAQLGRTANVHVLVDTGMHRLGVRHDRASELLQTVAGCRHLRLEGICTHFSSAGEASRAFSHRQLQRFLEVIAAARDLGLEPDLIHAANSAGLLNYESAHFTMVRPGIALHGIDPGTWPGPFPDLRPTLALRTQIAFIKDVPEGSPVSYDRAFYTAAPSRIATLPVGYSDGYRRAFSGPSRHGSYGTVLVNGQRCPVLGRITMDYTMVDVSTAGDCRVGDRVTLIGADGGDRIAIDEVAELADTVPYEISCGLGRRIVRLYRLRQGDAFVPADEVDWSR